MPVGGPPNAILTISVPPQNGLDSFPRDPNLPLPSNNDPSQVSPTEAAAPFHGHPPGPVGNSPKNNSSSSLPAARPVFGVSLDDLLKRDGSAIPSVIYQCIQAVDLFGLEVEGIYRLSGSSTHISKLKKIFDNGQFGLILHRFFRLPDPDSSLVDFRNPEAFYHDVNSVAGLLKQFFRELPNPLLSCEHYQGFIEAARESRRP